MVIEAVQRALADDITGYPLEREPELAESYAGWSARHFGWAPDPRRSTRSWKCRRVPGWRSRCSAGPGELFPTPGYNAQHGLAGITGRAEHLLEVATPAGRAEIDLDRLDRLFADGAGTLMLTQPHNPRGRVFTRAELEGSATSSYATARASLRRIHAPLVLPGAEHVSYLAVDGTQGHAVAVVAASKAFKTAGLSPPNGWSLGGRPALLERADVSQRRLFPRSA